MVQVSRIFTGLERINLKKLDALNLPIIELNKILTATEASVRNLNEVFKKQAANIQDSQFLLANDTVCNMVKKFNLYSAEVYRTQSAAEALFNKIRRFEPNGAYKTVFTGYRQINFTYQNPAIDPTKVLITKAAYIEAYRGLEAFKSEIESIIRKLSSIQTPGWEDRQSTYLKQFCTEIANDLRGYLKALIEYKNYIAGQIKIL